MNQLKVFDRALLGKRIAGNGFIVIVDVIYLIVGVFFGSIEFRSLMGFILTSNALTTCILYQNFLITQGDMKPELMTRKVLYYPTTRYQFLWNKYAKTLFFLLIQLLLTLACLGLGFYGNRGSMETGRVITGLLGVYMSILLTSGVAILLVHIMPLAIYLSMVTVIPLLPFLSWLHNRIEWKEIIDKLPFLGLVILITAFFWLVLLWIGGKVYEKVS